MSSGHDSCDGSELSDSVLSVSVNYRFVRQGSSRTGYVAMQHPPPGLRELVGDSRAVVGVARPLRACNRFNVFVRAIIPRRVDWQGACILAGPISGVDPESTWRVLNYPADCCPADQGVASWLRISGGYELVLQRGSVNTGEWQVL